LASKNEKLFEEGKKLSKQIESLNSQIETAAYHLKSIPSK